MTSPQPRYIYISTGDIKRQVFISDELIVDVAENGGIRGIEKLTGEVTFSDLLDVLRAASL